MALRRIIMRLARNPGYPDGDMHQGYTIVAPLDGTGKLDLDEWRDKRGKCTVFRFHPDPDERADGLLTHRGSHWFFHYDEDDEGPDEPAHKLADHVFIQGEYVSVRHHDEETLTYIVSDVSPA